MKVRAKFKVQYVEQTQNDSEGGGRVALEPVYTGSDENREFFRWTPGGSILLSTVNQTALDQFRPGDEFYVDFTKAPPPTLVPRAEDTHPASVDDPECG